MNVNNLNLRALYALEYLPIVRGGMHFHNPEFFTLQWSDRQGRMHTKTWNYNQYSKEESYALANEFLEQGQP